jgi:hypothetical protein
VSSPSERGGTMTDLTDPVQIEIPETTPAQPLAPSWRPAYTREPRIERRRSQRFTVRTSADAHSYASWERAIGAARTLASRLGIASSVTDDNSGTRFDVAPDGCASPSSS